MGPSEELLLLLMEPPHFFQNVFLFKSLSICRSHFKGILFIEGSIEVIYRRRPRNRKSLGLLIKVPSLEKTS